MRSHHSPTRRRWSAFAKTLAWTFLFVALADGAINFAFRLPPDPKVQPKSLANYFNYGQSIEAKLRYGLGSSDDTASVLSAAGWPDRDCQRAIPADAEHKVVSFYGMSFSNDVGRTLQALDPSYKSIFFSGPGASPNHSYHCFLRQLKYSEGSSKDGSEVQVLGLLASSVRGMLSMTGATVGFEAPAPFTYPRYLLGSAGQLQEISPLVNSSKAWRETLGSPDLRQAFMAQLSDNDAFYDPLLFNASWADNSAILRMLRRAYAQRSSRNLSDAVLGPEGYRDRPDIGPVLRAMVLDFAARSRAAGKRPVVLLLHDGHSGDALYRLLSSTLESQGVDYVSTHEIVRTNDPSNFVRDGHFTDAAYQRVAEKLRSVLRQ